MPLGRKFNRDIKNDLKKFHTISEGYTFVIKLLGEMKIQIFKIVWERWPKFIQVTKKSTDC